jgi:CHAT domain-containing protein
MLPIHAAGTKTESCSDYFVASYTPTLKAQTRARQGFHPPQKNDAKVLLAAVPVPFEGDWLPDVVSEIKMVKTAIPNSVVIPLPREADCTTNLQAGPTAQMVLDSIPEASILHLASHGTQVSSAGICGDGGAHHPGWQDHENALNSGFMMKDARLTVSKLMSLNLPNAFLAILSACETAKGDHSQPDQNVHLAAAMLYVGFRSVVGTMWCVALWDSLIQC